jgi:CheY-like chemotaxis protein
MVSTTEDITERIEVAQALEAAEAAARAANDAKNAFLSRMSHELRTPLNAVLGFGQLLERRLEGTEDAESVRYIVRAGRHLLDLINEVLDIARIESGEMSVSLEPIHVASLVQESADFMRPVAAATDVTLHVADESSDIHVLADRQRLRQILLNLLSNAIKYNHQNGNVWITGSSAADGVVISVRDDGRGIAPEYFDRIFTPFDRLGAEATGVEGTGVGLAVTHALVELMKGSVSVESEPGVGSCFAVTLPEVPTPAAEVLVASEYAPHPVVELDAVPASLLYIEDNDPNVRVVEALLKLRPGWRMLHAGLGRLGVELARAHHPDLVLLDLHLPDRLGIDVLAALQRDDATADIPVVVLTADANPHQLEGLLASGASRYLTKPLDIDVVLLMLDEIVAKKTVGQESIGQRDGYNPIARPRRGPPAAARRGRE